MSEAYLIAASSGPVDSISSKSRAEQAGPLLGELYQKTGIPSRRVQEIHWLGGDDEFWLTGLERQNGQLARFHWPASPLLAHYVLQACARTLELEERDLLLVAQEASGQVVVLLLASPPAVGRYNLAPRVRFGQRLSFSTAEVSLVASARAALEKTGLDPGEVAWLSAGRWLEPQSSSPAFTGAQWLRPGNGAPSGDLFLVQALAERLEKGKLALLLSQGPQHSGLGTLLERV